jgi:hypothetical protein
VEDEWKIVPGFYGAYEVTRCGRVRRVDSKRELTQRVTQNGYVIVAMFLREPGPVTKGKRGAGKQVRVHRAVALAWISNPNALPDVNHLDLNKLNNHADNLEWADDASNQAHATANKVYCPAHNPKRRHKLTPNHVQEVRALCASKTMTRQQIADRYNVSIAQINRIATGKQWKHLPPIAA